MMQKLFLIAALTLAGSSFWIQEVVGGTIIGTNYNLDSLTHKPIVTASGSPITFGGVVQLGSFTSADPSSLIAGLTSPAGLQALLADFIAFGSSTSIGASGAGFDGLYDIVAQAPIAAGDPLVGKSIYTLIGNGATLSGSTELAIIRDNGIFAFDAPLFVENASLLETTNQHLFGTGNGPVLASNSVFPANASLQLNVPEPLSTTLLLSALGLAARRRRAA